MKRNIIFGGILVSVLIISGLFGSGDFSGIKTAFGYGGGGRSGGSYRAVVVNTTNDPMTVDSDQEGVLNQSLGDGENAQLIVPIGATDDNTTFEINVGSLDQALNGSYFNIVAEDASGRSINNFSEDLQVELTGLDLPADISDLGLFYFNEAANDWVLVSDAKFNSAEGSVSFETDLVGKFAVFGKSTGTTTPPGGEVLGVKLYNEGTLIRTPDKKIYVVRNGQLVYIPTLDELAKNYYGQPITNVSYDVVTSYHKSTYATQGFPNNTLIRGADMKIYVIENGVKRHIKSLDELRANFAGQMIYDVTNDVLAKY